MGTVPKDLFGHDIMVGDTIAYPTGSSSNVAMNVGTVERIVEKDDPYRNGVTTCKLKIRKTFEASYGAAHRVSPDVYQVTLEKYFRSIILERKDGSRP